MLNWLLRYHPALRVVQDLDPAMVLDVGSGAYGLSWYWDGQVVQTDLLFKDRGALEQAQQGRRGEAHFVSATAESLPFRSASMPVVLSLDMFEHLPEAIRPAAAAELFRVAEEVVVVGYPVGRGASRFDGALAVVLRLIPGRRPLPLWLSEHLEQETYPDGETILAHVPPEWRLLRTHGSGNLLVQFLVVLAEILPGLRRLPARLERPWAQRNRLPWVVNARPTYRQIYVFARREPTAGHPALGATTSGS